MFGNLLDFFWGMMIIFFWVMALMIWFSCLMDMFRREDLTGGWKAIWLVVLTFLPFVGSLIYMMTRPKVTAQDVRQLAMAEAAGKAAMGISTADELSKLAQLRDAGAITIPEYDALKAKLLA
ncbi:MAG: SHOCT domain-containing protein [Chloroflexota bacterium]